MDSLVCAGGVELCPVDSGEEPVPGTPALPGSPLALLPRCSHVWRVYVLKIPADGGASFL